VNVRLPRFRIEETSDLVDTISQLGVVQVSLYKLLVENVG